MKPLTLIKNKPNQSAVEMVQELLEVVKSGEVVGVAICTVDRGHCSRTGWSAGDYHKYVMLAGMEVLKRDYLDREIEKR